MNHAYTPTRFSLHFFFLEVGRGCSLKVQPRLWDHPWTQGWSFQTKVSIPLWVRAGLVAVHFRSFPLGPAWGFSAHSHLSGTTILHSSFLMFIGHIFFLTPMPVFSLSQLPTWTPLPFFSLSSGRLYSSSTQCWKLEWAGWNSIYFSFDSVLLFHFSLTLFWNRVSILVLVNCPGCFHPLLFRSSMILLDHGPYEARCDQAYMERGDMQCLWLRMWNAP